ncbi:hypothetical protein ACFL08_03005 [Patescibacteria group bacterium]
MKLWKSIVVCLMTVSFLAACGLAEKDIENAKKVGAYIQNMEKSIKIEEIEFNKNKKKGDWEYLMNYSKYFSQSHAEIGKAKTFYKRVEVILKENDSSQANVLKSNLGSINQFCREAGRLAKIPNEKVVYFFKLKKDAPKMVSEAEKKFKSLEKSLGELDAIADDAKSKYSDRKRDIKKRFKIVDQSVDQVREVLKKAKKELRSSRPNYVVIGDSLTGFNSAIGASNGAMAKFKKDVAGLDRSYVKILDGMSLDYVNEVPKATLTYLIIEGEKERTETVGVGEAEYLKYEPYLGMALVTKPFGAFMDEVDMTPVPGGMSLIAKSTLVNGVPTGSNQYGQWKKDDNGTSFWVFYGQYALLSNLMSGPCYYNDWDHYDRHRKSYKNKPYFGSKNQYGTNGSKMAKSKRYKGRISKIRNKIKTARTKRVTVRNAKVARKTAAARKSARSGASSSRSRGSSGRGGK